MRDIRKPGMILLLCGGIWAFSPPDEPVMPYADLGWSQQDAAIHLLNRFAYGPTPEALAHLQQIGPEQWFSQQLLADAADPELDSALSTLDAMAMSPAEMRKTFVPNGRVLRMAEREGRVKRENLPEDRREQRELLREIMDEKGLRPVQDLVRQTLTQKLYRAVHAKNQLQEVMAAFWFNHFNVALTDNQVRSFVLGYERDAIRPNALGKFRTLLGATAKHPAMLYYLDNAQSTAPDSVTTTAQSRSQELASQPGQRGRQFRRRLQRQQERVEKRRQQRMQDMPQQFRPRRGINENYARELLELHTIGVDGGYTQSDIINIARAFTGWTALPQGEQADRIQNRIQRGAALGFMRDGEFIFRADVHDAEPKSLLGVDFPAGGGQEEGEKIFDMLAVHPATANRIAHKLAVRFVSDTPSDTLVQRLATVFLSTAGDTRALLLDIVASHEFWARENRFAKIKSPFELIASAARITRVRIRRARGLIEVSRRMGELPYGYQAPTGYPDAAGHWVNSGALLMRMNFGLMLGSGKIRGTSIDLAALNQNREPESLEQAVAVYTRLLLPGHDLEPLAKQFLPLAQAQGLANKVSERLQAPHRRTV